MLKEKELCSLFFAAIEKLKFYNQMKRGFFLFHIPNEQNNNIAYTMVLKRMGLKAGVADYCLLLEGGKVAFLEFKRNAKSKMTEKQKEFQKVCAELCIPYFLVHDVQQAIDIVISLCHNPCA
jgi:hypothetical protein